MGKRTIPIVAEQGRGRHGQGPGGEGERQEPFLGSRVEFQLFATLKCNISCSYCVMKVGGVLGSKGKPAYTVGQLRRWAQEHAAGKSWAFTFFGGEPLLNRPFIKEVIGAFPEARFQLQTNGTLLAKTDPEIVSAMDHFLISIDGGREATDRHRGRGVFDSVMRGAEAIRPLAKGRMTARMTWLDDSIGVDQIQGLLSSFDSVHFQFAQDDRGYSPASMAAKEAAVDALARAFFEANGAMDVVPLMGMVRNVARPDLADAQCEHGPHCRVSHALANVAPDGRVFGCPDMAWSEQMAHGSVVDGSLSRSPLRMTGKMPCHGCEAYGVCRGNCLKNLWRAYEMGDHAYRMAVVEPVCSLVRRMVAAVRAANPSAWLAGLPPEARRRALFHPAYEWTEVIP